MAEVLEDDEDRRVDRALVHAKQTAHFQGLNLGLVEHRALESVLCGQLLGALGEFQAAQLEHRRINQVAGLGHPVDQGVPGCEFGGVIANDLELPEGPLVLGLGAKEFGEAVGVERQAFGDGQGRRLRIEGDGGQLVFREDSAQVGAQLAQGVQAFGGRGVGVASGQQQVAGGRRVVHPTLHLAVQAFLVGIQGGIFDARGAQGVKAGADYGAHGGAGRSGNKAAFHTYEGSTRVLRP